MSCVLPFRFLFRYLLPARRCEEIGFASFRAAEKQGKPKRFSNQAEYALPTIEELDDQKSFGRISLAWNNGGIAIGVSVSGKSTLPDCDLKRADESDGLQVWLDTRDTQSIHRANRFCHHFCILPLGKGRRKNRPVAVQLPIARSREETSLADSSEIPIVGDVTENGYWLEAWLSADILTGYDPGNHPALGFSYLLRDSELGDQFLTVGTEFPVSHDPSLWTSLELIS